MLFDWCKNIWKIYDEVIWGNLLNYIWVFKRLEKRDFTDGSRWHTIIFFLQSDLFEGNCLSSDLIDGFVYHAISSLSQFIKFLVSIYLRGRLDELLLLSHLLLSWGCSACWGTSLLIRSTRDKGVGSLINLILWLRRQWLRCLTVSRCTAQLRLMCGWQIFHITILNVDYIQFIYSI